MKASRGTCVVGAFLVSLSGCVPAAQVEENAYPQTVQEWHDNPAAAVVALGRTKALLKEPIPEGNWDRALDYALDVIRRGCEKRIDLVVDAFCTYANAALEHGRPVPERLRKVLLEHIRSLGQERQMSRESARRLWNTYMRFDAQEDRLLEFQFSSVLGNLRENLVDLACASLDTDDPRKFKTAFWIVSMIPRNAEADWVALHKKWRNSEVGLRFVLDAMVKLMVQHGDAKSLPYVEEAVSRLGMHWWPRMIELLGQRWEKEGLFESRLDAARKACESGMPTYLNLWTVAQWGDERDVATMASLMAGPRSVQIAKDKRVFWNVSDGMRLLGGRVLKAVPFATAEHLDRFLPLDEMTQAAVLMAFPIGTYKYGENLWNASEDERLSPLVRAVAKVMYARWATASANLDIHLPRWEEKLGPGGKELLLRRMQEARQAVLAQENMPLRAKHIMARAIWSYKDCRPEADLPPVEDPLDPEKAEPSRDAGRGP